MSPTAALHHGGNESLAAVNDPPEIDSNHPLPVGMRGVEEHCAESDAGVVHENIHSPSGRMHLFGKRLNLRELRDVDPLLDHFAPELAQLGSNGIEAFLVDVAHGEVCTPSRKGQRGGAADAASRTRDENRLARKVCDIHTIP